MYTSKGDSDDVYAGQAHALGALDTLSKNLMKPARVDEVLAKLNILPGQEVDQHAPLDETSEPSIENAINNIQEPSTTSRVSANEFKAQIARLFELHIADVRTQIAENTKFIVRRLAKEIKNASEQEPRIDDVPISILNEETRHETHKANVISNTLIGLILVALVAISIQLFSVQSRNSDLVDSFNNLADLNRQSNMLLDDVVVASKAADAALNRLNNGALLDIVSWAVSIDMHFGYAEEPLGERQILNLQNLAFKLADAQFKGFIELNIQLGNFCLTQADGGEWVIPPDDTPIDKCTFLKDRKLDLTAENFTSVAYLQFEQSAAPIINGDIEFLINIGAFEDAIYAYPDLRPRLTAGEWNEIAAQNQQVMIIMETSN